MKKCELCNQTTKHTKWCNDTRRELNHLRKTGIPRCNICSKDYIRIDEFTWKSDCEHNKNLRMGIG